jgi:hypothetical protein
MRTAISLFSWAEVCSSNPHLAALWIAYATPPLLAVFEPHKSSVPQLTRLLIHLDWRSNLLAITLVPLPVGIEGDIEVRRLLLSLILQKGLWHASPSLRRRTP